MEIYPDCKPDIWTSLAVIRLLVPSSLRRHQGQWSLPGVTIVENDAPLPYPLNVLLDFFHLQSYLGAQDLVLDSNTVDQVAPDQRIRKSVEQILYRQHRGALGERTVQSYRVEHSR